jgi:hypothetical protein
MLPKILLDRLREFMAEPIGWVCVGSVVAAIAGVIAVLVVLGTVRRND